MSDQADRKFSVIDIVSSAVALNPAAYAELERQIQSAGNLEIDRDVPVSAFMMMGRMEDNLKVLHVRQVLFNNDGFLENILRKGWPYLWKRLRELPESGSPYTLETILNRYDMDGRSDYELMHVPAIAFLIAQVFGKAIDPGSAMFQDFCQWALDWADDTARLTAESGSGRNRKGKYGYNYFRDHDDRIFEASDDAESRECFDIEMYTRGIRLSEEEWNDIREFSPNEEAAYITAIYNLVLKAAREDVRWSLAFQGDTEIELARLKNRMADADRERNALEEKVKDLERQNDLLSQKLDRKEEELAVYDRSIAEVAALRTALHQLDDPEPVPPKPVRRTLPARIVSVGGSENWCRIMRKEIPEVQFIPADVSLPEDTIRSADEVWFEASYLGHSLFYKAMGLTTGSVRYWPGRNPERCRNAFYFEDT